MTSRLKNKLSNLARPLRLIFLLITISATSLNGWTQIECNDCDQPICAGTSLSNFIEFGNEVQEPVNIQSFSGSIFFVGPDNELSNYNFNGSGDQSISLGITDANGTSFDTTFTIFGETATANFVFTQGNCTNVDFTSTSASNGELNGFSWIIYEGDEADGQPLGSMSGPTPQFEFPSAGEYTIELTVTTDNGCSNTSEQTITVGGLVPEIQFTDELGDQIYASASNICLIPYCQADDEAFELYISDISSIIQPANNITSVEVTLNGNPVADPFNGILAQMAEGEAGYQYITITVSDGTCEETKDYEVYFGSDEYYSTMGATPDLDQAGCPGEEYPLTLQPGASNPDGVDYQLEVLCGTDIVETYTWDNFTPPDPWNFDWTPTTSSCNCPTGFLTLRTTALHPCTSTPGTGTQDVRISSPVEATFTAPEEVCVNELVELFWPGGNQLNNISWCDSELEWTIEDEDGNPVVVDNGATEATMSHTFTSPGTYEVFLEVENDNCNEGGIYSDIICVEPDLSGLTLDVDWNLPATICEGDEVTPELTPLNADLCSAPSITWTLYQGASFSSSQNGNSPTFGPLDPGSYTLQLTYSTACGSLQEEIDFDVARNPEITSNLNDPFSNACPDEEICLDDWFCVEYNAPSLSSFQMEIYDGDLSNCENPPAGQLLETITNQNPNPDFEPCDPNSASCDFLWTAQPGQYTLRIVAENDCGSHVLCIPIDIPEPDQPELDGDEVICADEIATIEASQGGGSFSFLSCPDGCPTEGSAEGQFELVGNEIIWNTSATTEPGVYEIEYSGDCIISSQIEITVNEIPEFEIVSDPTDFVCNGEEVELDINYTGNNSVATCDWTNLTTGGMIVDTDCAASADPEPGVNEFEVEVTDGNGCSATSSVEIEELVQPFTQDCSSLESTYCDNEGEVVEIQNLLTPYPSTGSLSWSLNGSEISGSEILVDTLSQGTQSLEWSWEHPDLASCVFTDSCEFDVVPATTPTLEADSICAGEILEVEATQTNGINGTWTFESCPGDCPDNAIQSDNALEWQTETTTEAGTYELSFGGACLVTQTLEVEVNTLPVFEISSDLGELLCEGDEVTLSIENFNDVASCEWADLNSGDNLIGVDCEVTLSDVSSSQSINTEVTDSNGCSTEETINLSIQQQPFTFDPSPVEDVYCDNSEDEIDLESLLSPHPSDGDLQWFLNDEEVSATSIQVLDLDPDDYELVYEFSHGTAPNCFFTDTLSFSVEELTVPNLVGEIDYCLGSEVTFEAQDLNGFSGGWTNTNCPGADCIDPINNSSEFSWESADAELGTYTLEFAGECLETIEIDFVLYSNPVTEWTPVDETPCLNECLEVGETELSNYDSFDWTFETTAESGSIQNNTLCLENLVDSQSLEICLWASIDHETGNGILTCETEDCHDIQPVASPGDYPELPETACPEEIIDLNINDALYDNCTFWIEEIGTFDNCSSALIEDGFYGTFADSLFLEYSGCQDTLTSEIFIPEPPSGEFEVDYDPCVADVTTLLSNVSGDELSFDWDILNEVDNNYDFLLDDPTIEQATPNPVELSQLDLTTDSTFFFVVEISNTCETLILEDTVEFIAAPNVEVDVQAESQLDFCFPELIQFELFEFATYQIDSVYWDFDDEYGNASLSDTTLSDTFFPPLIEYTNIGAIDSVFVNATAWNQCGSDTDTLMIVLHPPDVFIEMPQEVDGICPGETVSITPVQVQGVPWNGCEVTSEPNIVGLQYSCIGELDAVEITIPQSTPPGVYELTTSISGCGSDADVTFIEVFPNPQPDFEIADGSCTGKPVAFLNNSQNATNFEWDFGDPDTGDDNFSFYTAPSHIYDLPGDYNVTMWATSADGCEAMYDDSITISGPDASIFPGNQSICSGEEVQLYVEEQGKLVQLGWEITHPNFEPLIFSFQNEISQVFYNPSDTLQIWEVSVEMLNLQNCYSQSEALIFVKPTPTASFSYSEIENCAQGAEVTFYNNSTEGVSTSWDFGDPVSGNENYSSEWAPTHFFSGPENFGVELLVQNSFGCSDYQWEVLPCSDFTVFIPNAFTPDGDFTNELFKPVIDGIEFVKFIRPSDYTFTIFDRWGAEIFETHDPSKGWNGNNKEGNHYVQPGVYSWQLIIEFPSGRTEMMSGVVSVVR
jgi:hypothetical protein